MDGQTYTGSDGELDDLVDAVVDEVHAQWRDDANFKTVETAPFKAWRDSAVARHLAEAGAVHPAVHTPERVAGWMEAHGWKRDAVTDMSILWTRDDRRTVQPLLFDAVDFPRVTAFLVHDVAWAHGLTVEQVLLEIASMPEELPW